MTIYDVLVHLFGVQSPCYLIIKQNETLFLRMHKRITIIFRMMCLRTAIRINKIRDYDNEVRLEKFKIEAK